MSESKKINRKVIQSKHVGAKYEKQFFLEIQEAIINGWRIVDNNVLADQSRRMYGGRWGKVVMYYPDGTPDVEPEIEEQIEKEEDSVEAMEEKPKKTSKGKKA